MRVPPHDRDAEKLVLGACMESQGVIAKVLEMVDRKDFYVPVHRKIFAALADLYRAGEPTDAIALAGALTAKDEIDEVGGKPYLADLMGHYSSRSAALSHARTVHQHALLRSLIQVTHDIADKAFEVPKDVTGLLEEAGARVFQLVNDQSHDDRHAPRSMAEDLGPNLEELEELGKAEKPLGFTSGIATLDKIMGGFQKGSYIVVGAGTSQGKTSLLTQLATQAARQERNVLMVTLEQPRRELIHRILAQEANVDVSHFRNPQRMIEDDWIAISKAAGDIPTGRIYFTDGSVDLNTLQSRVRRAVMKAGRIDLLVVDYIQLVQGVDKAENRTQEIGTISRFLKSMANDQGMTVLAASQLNRSPTKEKRRPVLDDLRESGSLEHDADMVILFHRPERKKDEVQLKSVVPTELLIRKNRHGPIGVVDTNFLAAVNRFEEM